MVKRLVPSLLLLVLCTGVCFASIADDPEIADGYLTDGEYVSMGVLEGYEELFVMGGGAETIDVRDYGYLEVQDTAKPLGYHSGIYDIVLYDNSNLLHLGGITEEITTRKSATATLKGGRIDYISSLQIVYDSPHITLECQSGWSWLYNTSSQIKGITGLWADDTDFTINFIDKDYLGYDPVWMNINVVIVPEPATLLLFAAGGLFLRRKN